MLTQINYDHMNYSSHQHEELASILLIVNTKYKYLSNAKQY